MTPEERDAFLTVHRDLPREGPGTAADVLWALDRLGVQCAANVLDAACGPGADLLTLAEALPEAQITGIEQVPQFVEAARARTAAYAPRVTVVEGDMRRPGGPFDLIWCAGALYFLGVTDGLQGWRAALEPGGAVVFSEPVLRSRPASVGAAAFWQDYPQITDLDGITAQIRLAGYRVQDHRLIVGQPWQDYYAPMQARIDALRAAHPGVALTAALDENQLEIDRWQAARDDIAYALLIAVPE